MRIYNSETKSKETPTILDGEKRMGRLLRNQESFWMRRQLNNLYLALRLPRWRAHVSVNMDEIQQS